MGKGRIERAWRTCQDRLVSELRLARATTLQQANAVLDRFCADYNQRFARPAADTTRDFRSLPRRFDLARCLSLHYQRVVAADHTVTLGAHAIALPPLPGHRDVLVKGYVHEVMIVCGSRVIARHRRSYQREDMVFDPLHYLALLEQKTRALDQAAPLVGWELPECWPSTW